MKKAVWGVLSAAVALSLLSAGTATVHAQHSIVSLFHVPYANPSANGQGAFPLGTDHHIGQLNFSVTLGHNGPEGNFEFNEKNLQGQNVQHILLHPIDTLSIAGNVARMEGATLWNGVHARVRAIATDDGEHHDSLSVRVVATDGPNAGKVLYEVSGVLTSGAIHVLP